MDLTKKDNQLIPYPLQAMSNVNNNLEIIEVGPQKTLTSKNLTSGIEQLCDMQSQPQSSDITCV